VTDDDDVDSLITTYAPDFWKKYHRSVYNFRNLKFFEHSFSTFPLAALADSFTHHAYKDMHFYYYKISYIDASSQAAVMVSKPAQGWLFPGRDIPLWYVIQVKNRRPITTKVICDFKVSPCCECCILSFGWFPGLWILCADVSEHSVCSIFIGRANKNIP